MQGKHLYEYAIIRVLPKVEREEFINIGLILFSKRNNYLKAQYHLNERKLLLFATELEIDSLRKQLQIFDRICSGNTDGGVIASMDVPERFRWLTAVRSSSIQTSRPHPGFTNNLDETFQKLFTELVL